MLAEWPCTIKRGALIRWFCARPCHQCESGTAFRPVSDRAALSGGVRLWNSCALASAHWGRDSSTGQPGTRPGAPRAALRRLGGGEVGPPSDQVHRVVNLLGNRGGALKGFQETQRTQRVQKAWREKSAGPGTRRAGGGQGGRRRSCRGEGCWPHSGPADRRERLPRWLGLCAPSRPRVRDVRLLRADRSAHAAQLRLATRSRGSPVRSVP